MPFCAGMRVVGIGTSINTLGMINGISPRKAYLSRISATRPSAGVAGNGKPLKSILSINTVRSSPVIDSVELPGSRPGRIC